MRFPKRNGGLYPAAHFCVLGICIITNNVVYIKYRNKNPKIIFTSNIILYFQIFFYVFPLLTAIHLFTRSVTKSKISTSPVKKLVTAHTAITNFFTIYIQFYLLGYFDEMRRKLNSIFTPFFAIICEGFSMRNA